jgi:hypothetical protein
MMSQEQMLGFMTKQLIPVAARNLALPEMFSRYVREHSLGQLEASSLKTPGLRPEILYQIPGGGALEWP